MGSTSRRAWSAQPSAAPAPSTGSQSSQTEKTSSSRIATTNDGMAISATDTPASSPSSSDPGRTAARQPSGTPSRIASPMLVAVSTTV